ncbi:low molecular weight protein-tyrosine-phosphatase [Enterocloster asparagiformis]|uniref:low molecular weight protein-tyrosine-phosphatase n=1 Tax=Enterocloster asparagiformis TaxID=333367 RepID=UPI0004674926|nr:low molecular weight protein-tyrosine-phosphatase [Enterocloster asparagiformis]
MNKQYQNSINILFVCHGNICRSPLAEYLLRHLIQTRGLSDSFHIASAATSREEIGNPVHRGTRAKLQALGISTAGKCAVRLEKQDYGKYDYLIGMDRYNITDMLRILGGDPDGKVSRLLDFTDHPRDVADPWYTGDFDTAYDDVLEGCNALLDHILSQKPYFSKKSK